MKAVSRGVAALAVTVLVAASGLHAQSAEFSLGGGLGIPTGTFDDVAKLGWQGMAAVSFTPARMPVGIQVDGNYSQFSDESPLDIKDRLIYGTANAVYKFESSPDTRWRPYLIGGVGLYNSKETGDDALGGTSTKFGINVGAGFNFKAGAAGLFIESRFHDVFTDGPNVKFIPVNLGIRFGSA